MYSCVLYGQTTDKGNEPDGRKIDYTDKGPSEFDHRLSWSPL